MNAHVPGGRIWTKLIFTQRNSENFRNSLLIYDRETSKAKRITREHFDFLESFTIQCGSSLYELKGGTPAQWVAYHDLEFDAIETEAKATPPTPRDRPSLANYNDSHIFVVGGKKPGTKQHLKSVDIYDVEKNIWRGAPALNVARFEHSSCCVGDFIYVGFGWNSSAQLLVQFERLDVAKMISG